jgi:hypothetical protein
MAGAKGNNKILDNRYHSRATEPGDFEDKMRNRTQSTEHRAQIAINRIKRGNNAAERVDKRKV